MYGHMTGSVRGDLRQDGKDAGQEIIFLIALFSVLL